MEPKAKHAELHVDDDDDDEFLSRSDVKELKEVVADKRDNVLIQLSHDQGTKSLRKREWYRSLLRECNVLLSAEKITWAEEREFDQFYDHIMGEDVYGAPSDDEEQVPELPR